MRGGGRREGGPLEDESWLVSGSTPAREAASLMLNSFLATRKRVWPLGLLVERAEEEGRQTLLDNDAAELQLPPKLSTEVSRPC